MLVRGFRAGLNQPRRKPAGHAADRNKCTLQATPSGAGALSSASVRDLVTLPILAFCPRVSFREESETEPGGSAPFRRNDTLCRA
jgi:hypothetical protein